MKKFGLDLLDRKILYELDLDSRISFKELGKKLSIAKETAAFRVKRLQVRGYIKNFITTIHISKLNRFYYKLFYKFHKTTPEIDEQIIDFIKNYRSTSYFASLEGRYDIVFLILAKDMQDLRSFLVRFKERFSDYVLEQEILTLPSVNRFNFRFFLPKKEVFHTKYPEQLAEPDIDDLDLLVIESLAKDSRISLVDLAAAAKTEPNVIKYRMKKLTAAGILGTHVLDINFEKFGLEHIQIDYSLRNHSSVQKMIASIAMMPQSTFATVTLGKYDLAVEFVVESMEELRGIIKTIKQAYANEVVNHDIFILQEHSINWFPYEQRKRVPEKKA
ncbi:MAG: Lrp/AsnC family transcriptional regulator [Nanoarchaeota archaeon]